MKKYTKPVIIPNSEMDEETRENVVAALPFMLAAASLATAAANAVSAYNDKNLDQKMDCLRKVG